MKILMVTNTYPPHVGGVAVSVKSYVDKLLEDGHKVLVLAPTFEGAPDQEENVVRVAAIQNFNGSDFSVRLPIPSFLSSKLNQFRPDVVHSHHPFLLGDTALRIANKWNVPIVFTYHTMYERYTHYVPGDSPALKQFVIKLSAGYANLCHRVIAPSESIKSILINRGVETPIEVIPTGINISRFKRGARQKLRFKYHIPKTASVIGHVGRLAPEKNLIFLAKAIVAFLKSAPSAHFIVVGEGSSEAELKKIFSTPKLRKQVHFTGTLVGKELADALHAMDLFVFASTTETQGLVIAEAMAAGLPVIALDASGVREVVKTGRNGTLLKQQNIRKFKAAISDYFSLDTNKKEEFSHNASSTAKSFSMNHTYKLLIKTYHTLSEEEMSSRTDNDSTWENTLSLIETEWSLMKNRLQSANPFNWLLKYYRLLPFNRWFAKLKTMLDTNYWAMKLLKLERVTSQSRQRGLIMIQIDGLSKPQLEVALTRNKLSFINHLLNKQNYKMHTFYSGIPSTTPAVQAELFYNVRAAVPAFSFYSRRLKRDMIMYSADCASLVEKELKEKNGGLLKGGSSYSNVYTGGADEAHFSPAALGWQHFQESLSTRSFIYFLIWQLFTIPRVIVLGLTELFLAVADFVSGVDRGHSLMKELRFIPSRIAITVILRELVAAGAILDIARGLPIIHLNLLGYDEQSHRRGPASRFAHWSLKGIDGVIRKIRLAAQKAPHRHYQVWIYSDHGQEHTIGFEKLAGLTIKEAVSRALPGTLKATVKSENPIGHQLSRASYLKLFSNLPPDKDTEESNSNTVLVKALGPVGHIYLPSTYNRKELKETAKLLVEQGIPSVLFSQDESIFWCDKHGVHNYNDYAPHLFDKDLPYHSDLINDIRDLVNHPDAGNFVILGYNKHDQRLVTFVLENGSHAGPGPNETQGFLLMPAGSRYSNQERTFYRPSDLRDEVQYFLRQRTAPKDSLKAKKARSTEDLRIMTYNIRSGRGSDNLFCLERVTDVIDSYHPDIVCLQEVDVTRQRSSGIDQARYLAENLQMKHFFHPTFAINGELYGNAIITNLPFSIMKASTLPSLPGKPMLEPRASIWLTIDTGKHKLHLINVHLSLNRLEREIQINELLGPRWSQHPDCINNHLILCGDFNMTTRSYTYRQITKMLKDSNSSNGTNKANLTWPSFLPVVRLDYIFTSQKVSTKRAFVARNATATTASDHLPFISDIKLL